VSSLGEANRWVPPQELEVAFTNETRQKKVAAANVKEEGAEKDFTHMTSARSTPAQRVLLEAALRADPVLGPLLDFGRCVVTYGGEPGTHCCYGQPYARCTTAAELWVET
jgi:hypothetical protein